MEDKIYLKSKNSVEFEDYTNRVASISREGDGWNILFKGYPKEYFYSDDKVRVIGKIPYSCNSKEKPIFKYDTKKTASENVILYLAQFCMSQNDDDENKEEEEETEDDEEQVTPFGLIADKLSVLTIKDDSVLKSYINGKTTSRNQPFVLAFPFGCNGSCCSIFIKPDWSDRRSSWYRKNTNNSKYYR